MTLRTSIGAIFEQEDLNFLLTNRVPRRLLTRCMGWLSRIEQPLVRNLSIAVWRLFCDVDLSDAKKQEFASLHDCFVRELKDGARPIDAAPGILVSPCDAIVGACGTVSGGELLQIKGRAYPLRELLGDRAREEEYAGGTYVTLRLTAGMYHRFHAPHDCAVEQVAYIPGDVWNVNPAALKRVDKLYCRNERALVRTRLALGSQVVTLVPVAAILVAGIRLRFLDLPFKLGNGAATVIPCEVRLRKGEEMGWFEHGSTIIVLAPQSFTLADGVHDGRAIRMGQPLMRLP
ncbi:MAG: phosphatidylserine decarboxylase [Bradyrhizobiaceae bacterium]|nr:phosphatidylserine decarboxylase [Hyphomicrobiales bacterium]MBV9428732.1 phosphatidylserine decarboxylase [Bradyrhizobiaceae bacterium]